MLIPFAFNVGFVSVPTCKLKQCQYLCVCASLYATQCGRSDALMSPGHGNVLPTVCKLVTIQTNFNNWICIWGLCTRVRLCCICHSIWVKNNQQRGGEKAVVCIVRSVCKCAHQTQSFYSTVLTCKHMACIGLQIKLWAVEWILKVIRETCQITRTIKCTQNVRLMFYFPLCSTEQLQ